MNFLVVGDTMTDRYWIGESTRDNPDGPSPLVAVRSIVSLEGGAGNVASNLEALGANVFLTRPPGDGTIIKNRVVNGDRVVVRFDQGDRLRPIQQRYDLATIAAMPCSAVVVADYAKGGIDDELVGWIKSLNKPTFVDCKTRPDRWANWVDCMFPNVSEYRKNLEIYEGASSCLMIKRGPLGCTFREGPMTDYFAQNFPSRAVNVVNPTGAGDTAMAAFVVAVTSGSLYSEACEFAMCAAALSVGAVLTHAPTVENIFKTFEDPIAKKLFLARVAA